MIHEIFEGIAAFFRVLLTMLNLGSFLTSSEAPSGKGLRVFIKQGNQTVSADLDPSWNLRKIKCVVAPKLNCSPDELKIIFAGRELHDDVILGSCDVGQNSCLFAVRVQIQPKQPQHQEIQHSSSKAESKTESNCDVNEEILDKTQSEEAGESAENEDATANKRSEYFVYCNKCEDFEEGKLRVRCDTCLSGAFIVLRDPESWEDVLKAKQVPGSCETPECSGSFAQFYFKCAAHITTGEDDTAPPLSMLKRNPDEIPCLACGDSKDPVFIFDCENQHVTCIDCFKQYVLVKLNERQFKQDPVVGYTLGCPALCQNSLIKDAHHFKLVGKYQYDRYQRFGAEEYVLKNGGVLCPQPDCGMGILPMDAVCNKIACTYGCGYVFCRLCLEGWHVGPCNQDGSTPGQPTPGPSSYSVPAERAAKAQWDDKSRRAIRITTKPCPNCRAPTEKSAGCQHMTCPKCQFDWCWICQVKWNRECQGNHWFG